MKIEGVPFGVIDWDAITGVKQRGQTGSSYWRTFEAGNIRVRMVDYSPGFLLDHWCSRGHVILGLEGELTIILKDGSSHPIRRGMSAHVGDDDENPHMLMSEKGAKVFIVD